MRLSAPDHRAAALAVQAAALCLEFAPHMFAEPYPLPYLRAMQAVHLSAPDHRAAGLAVQTAALCLALLFAPHMYFKP